MTLVVFSGVWCEKVTIFMSALKLVMNLMNGDELGVVVVAVDNGRALVTVRELAQHREVHRLVPPTFNKTKVLVCLKEKRS